MKPSHCSAVRILLLSFALGLCAQPAGAAAGDRRMCAEWEPAFGTLIRWPLGIPSDLVVELAADDSLYVLVETSGQESQARSAFTAYGVDLDHVRFIRAATYSHWTRDWGPHSIFDDDGVYGITDPYFDGYPWVPGCFIDSDTYLPSAGGTVPRRGEVRGYEEDDAVNAVLAEEFNCPLHEMPAYCTGGNIMGDGRGIAFSTRRMVNENAPLWSEEEFRQIAQQYLGVRSYHFLDDPEVHGIQHIDCYAKLLDEETVLVKEVSPGHPEYACIERLVDQFSAVTNCYGRPYTIVRIYCGSYGGSAVAAYTNSLILNRKVLVPLFGITSDAAALETYRQALPGYEVLGFHSSSWYYYDALHCRTMGIFDRHMLRLAHRPLDAEVPLAGEYTIDALIDDRSEQGLVADSLRVHWRVAGAGDWQFAPFSATAAVDSFRAVIPWQAPGTAVEYFLTAADSTDRRETLPRGAPAGVYRFVVLGDPAHTPNGGLDEAGWRLHLAPNPFQNGTHVGLDLPAADRLRVTVLDVTGRPVRTLYAGPAVGALDLRWNGAADGGRPCPAGVYAIVARDSRGGCVERRCLLIR